MSRATTEVALPAGQPILLDTTALIAYLNKGELVSPVAAYIIDDLVRTGRNQAIVSMITVMEILVRPLRQGASEAYQHIMDFVSNFPNLRLLNIDLDVAQEAASLRATYNIRPPDALIIATGILGQVGHLVTNDDEWHKKLGTISDRIEVCHLEDHLPFS